MSYLKRITVSLGSQIENLVSQVEDHEAVVDAAISDAQKSLAAAKLRLTRVIRDEEQLQEQISSLKQSQLKWRNRAKQVAQNDEVTALECLRRSKEAGVRVENLQHVHAEHQRQREQLQSIIRQAEQQIQEKIQRRNLMSTRENALRSSRSLEHTSAAIAADSEQTFDRWQTRITEMEIGSAIDNPVDSLEHEFSSKEEIDELKLELDELMQEETRDE